MSGRIFNEEIFKPDFEFDGPHLVAASAGTGKTYNIQNIYARLVAEKGLRARELLVMTFTDAATKELRDRIRAVLTNFSLYLGGRQGEILKGEQEARRGEEIARLERLRACARATIGEGDEKSDRTARARVEIALAEFDQAAISTIHGFCRRALLRFAFETGSAFRSEFEDSKAEEIARRVNDWWRKERNHAPEDVRGGLDLVKMRGYAIGLSGKADPIPVEDASEPAESFMLTKAAELAREYEDDRQMRDTQTFDDLLRGVRDALRDEAHGAHLAALLREEFKAALVDEFQDTDPVQYEIFRRVFLDPVADPRPSLFFVGDPKQAIYSFRGGDIYTYKAAVGTPEIRGKSFRLDTNYRSTAGLIAAVNMIFKDVKGPEGELHRTFGDDAIDYENDLRACGRVEGLKVGGAEDPQPFRFVWTESATLRTVAVVDAVLTTLEEQRKSGLSPRDIAILVSSHGAARELRDELRRRGVPVVLQRSGNVFASEVAEEFRIVLQAMALIGGHGQVRAAMATSFFTYGPADLVGESADSVLADMIGFFGELNRIWQTRGFNAAFAALESSEKCDLRRRFAQKEDGERKLADLLQIAELLGAATRELGPTPETLVDWMTERVNQSGEDGAEGDSDEYARELESEREAVKIMTIHVSKGLQFPVVIVPVSCGKPPARPYFFHDENGRLNVSVGRDHAGLSGRENDEETTRKLYVAFTRAKQRTIVVSLKEGRYVSGPLLKLAENAKANGAEVAGSPIRFTDFAPIENDERRYEAPKAADPVFVPAEMPVAFDWRPIRGSYSSLTPEGRGMSDDGRDTDANREGNAQSLVAADEERHPIFAIGGGAKTGTCWHDILERLPFDADDAAIRRATESALKVHGLKTECTDKDESVDAVAVVSEMIKAMLDYTLTSPAGRTFSLREVGPGERLSEWEFDFSSASASDTMADIVAIVRGEWGGDESKAPFLAAMENWTRTIPKGFLKGFLDLMFRHDGYYYVVDWKSNAITGSASGFDEAGVRAEMASAGYFFQYLLYSAVLHRFLKERLGDAYSWNGNFGGVRYYFLRGIAAGGASPVFADRPSERLLDRLARALGLEGK
ncbi:MAG: UvrD-helicase domain-containing protein [Kiritimatiellae bacterium]|nr:UvrD-helicase domain-containing protein [Kiritimatiellia bacterium]